MQVNCLPWDYPPPAGVDGSAVPLCTSYNDKKTNNNSRWNFEMAMDDAEVNKACTNGCLPDCEETDYDFQVDTTNLEVDRLCKDAGRRDVSV